MQIGYFFLGVLVSLWGGYTAIQESVLASSTRMPDAEFAPTRSLPLYLSGQLNVPFALGLAATLLGVAIMICVVASSGDEAPRRVRAH